MIGVDSHWRYFKIILSTTLESTRNIYGLTRNIYGLTPTVRFSKKVPPPLLGRLLESKESTRSTYGSTPTELYFSKLFLCFWSRLPARMGRLPWLKIAKNCIFINFFCYCLLTHIHVNRHSCICFRYWNLKDTKFSIIFILSHCIHTTTSHIHFCVWSRDILMRSN